MLEQYRILDLTQNVGNFCGYIFAELGAEVIRVEKPEGNPARGMGPFYKDISGVERSLLWWAYNLNQKSITLDIERKDDREFYQKLVKKVDVVLESFPAGYLDRLGLGYEHISSVNPQIIMTSVTPYGQSGKYAHDAASELTIWAESGALFLTGEPERPPLQANPPQSYFLGGLFAAVGTIVALYHRGRTGEGQRVDAAALDAASHLSNIELAAFWQFKKELIKRSGQFRRRGVSYSRIVWPCKDGYVSFVFVLGEFVKRLRPLMEWMVKEDLAGPLVDVDWETVDMAKLDHETISGWENTFGKFFLNHTKEELTAFCQRNGVLLTPVNSPKDIVEDEHLASIGFWQQVVYPELSTVITHPGGFPCDMSEAKHSAYRRPPRLGENNEEIRKWAEEA